MQNKYNLSLEQNIFLAKRNLVDNIYANARLEGVNITFSQTKTTILLSEFYSTNNKEKIKQFIFDNCIDGIVFE